MKRTLMFAALTVVACIGCEPTVNFYGSVKVNRLNGEPTSVEVRFPETITVSSRENMDRLVAQVDSLLGDLKAARDQFPVDEPKEPRP